MPRSLLREYIDSLPQLCTSLIRPLSEASSALFHNKLADNIGRIFLTGCGDSHHAALCAAMAYERLGGVPCYPQTAMQFSRFSAHLAPYSDSKKSLLMAISASGEVARTIEALEMAKQSGIFTVAVTGNGESTLASVADEVLVTMVPPLREFPANVVVPGSRSFMGSLIALYTSAVALGRRRGELEAKKAEELILELSAAGESIRKTILWSGNIAESISSDWRDAEEFVFCGAGPNYGAALFSAAKLLEASGDPAMGQDLEEWAHLQYFSRRPDTPTMIMSSGERDWDRAQEIAIAARALGRRLAIVAPRDAPMLDELGKGATIFLTYPIRDCFSPLVSCIPGLLLASERALLLNEPYFRDFAGGRNRTEGGGISRIRTSHRIEKPFD